MRKWLAEARTRASIVADAARLQAQAMPPASELLDRSVGKAVLARKSLDISAADLAFGLAACANSDESERAAVDAEIGRALHGDVGRVAGDDVFTALCVRTAFDALLSLSRFPRGKTAIIMSGIQIADMVTIAESHACRVFAVDVSPETLLPDPKELEETIARLKKAGFEPRMFVLAHVFGARSDCTSLIQVCRASRLLFVEDCAEAFSGPGRSKGGYIGNDASDLVLFSFGTIKTSTALGGCIGRVPNNPTLLASIKAQLSRLPVRSSRVDAARFARYAALNPLTQPRVFGAAVRALNSVGGDHDSFIRTQSRGFRRDQDLFEQLRLRPSVALLKLVLRRLRNFNFERAELKRSYGAALAQAIRESIPEEAVLIPGAASEVHEYWLFPVVLLDDDVDLLHVQRRMFRDGFDVTSGTTQLSSLDEIVSGAQGDPNFAVPERAKSMMKRIVYLPFSVEASTKVRNQRKRRLVKSLGRAIGVIEEAEEGEDDDDDDDDETPDGTVDDVEYEDSDDEDEGEEVAPTRPKL